MNKKFTRLPSDYPIQSLEEDSLEREKVVKHFVKTVLNLERSKGVVTSIFGPWGSGKTSFINLVKEQLKQQYDVLEFNPWMFHGTKQLIEVFFDEISDQMISKEKDTSLAQIGNLFREYGIYLSIRHITSRKSTYLNNWPKLQSFLVVVKPYIRAIGRYIRRKIPKEFSRNSGMARRRIETILNKRNDHPIIVVIDDIDRLPASEIRDIFQLVRLTASFPNLIYVVVCDRNQVERALKKQGLSGRKYLEKIVQFPFDLPRTSRTQIDKQTSMALKKVLSTSASPSLFNTPAWLDIYSEIILPLIRNMRDVRRYSIAAQQALINFDHEIEQVDILALEAIRLFLPDVFKLLPEVIDILTVPPIGQSDRNQNEALTRKGALEETQSQTSHKERGQKLIDAGKSHGRVIQSMLHYLFPVTPNRRQESVKLLQTCRVAHENILRLYLEQTAPNLLVFHNAQRALKAMGNKAAFEEFWHQQDPEKWWETLLNLEELEDEFLPEQVIPGATVMLNLLPSMPVLQQHPYHDNRLAVIRVVLRLFRKLEDATAIENSMRKVLIKTHSLSSKMALIEQASYESKVQNKFISEVAVKEFMELLCEQVRSASSDGLAEEYETAHLVHFVKSECRPSDNPYEIENSPKLTYSLLRSAQNQPSGMEYPYNGLPEPRISWKFLSGLYGDEKMLITCIKTLDMEFENLKPWFKQQNISLNEAQQTLALAREYVQRDPEISS